ncbi:MAG: PorV/PorQ family protein [bacterium]|nr:MAG: PorV/PorQ family protein [bacterium]
MSYKKFIILALAVAVLLVGVQAEAGTGKRIGTAGASELLIPVGARATALGGANLASVSGIDAMYWNPAGVAGSSNRAEAMFSHLTWIGDINVEYIAAVANLGAFGSFGLNVKTLNFGDIVETTVDNPDGTGSTFSPNYLTLGFTYSRKMTDRIHFGVNAKFISEKIMSVSATGLGFDFGLQYVNSAAGIKIGAALTNFGGDMRYSGPDLETRVQLPGTETGTTISSVAVPVASFDLPSQLKFGVSYDVSVAEDNMVSVMGSFVNNAYSFDQYTIGGEYNFREMFFLRGSYTTAYKEGLEGTSDGFTSSSENFIFGPAFGAGFKLGVGANMSLMVDYAYRTSKYFDNNQWFSMTIGF